MKHLARMAAVAAAISLGSITVGLSSSASFALEPGQQLTWSLSNRAGENAFSPTSSIAASISIAGEIIVLN